MPIRELGRHTTSLPKVPADGAQLMVALATWGGSWFYGPFEGPPNKPPVLLGVI
jgi:hypothetical protein